jgi:hypothetical protein
MKYLITSGYFNKPGSGLDWFFPIWWENTMKANPKPEKAIVISQGGHSILNAPGEWIKLNGDMQDRLDLEYYAPNQIAVCIGALLAWLEGCDFIYKEQDLLAFGPWVERLYSECGKKKMTFGFLRNNDGSNSGWAANSLTLIKHEFCFEFVRFFLGTEPVRESNIHSTSSESKFHRLARERPSDVSVYEFGYDRNRPFRIEDEVWTVQKLTGEELVFLKEKGLIDFTGNPPTNLQISNFRNV